MPQIQKIAKYCMNQRINFNLKLFHLYSKGGNSQFAARWWHGRSEDEIYLRSPVQKEMVVHWFWMNAINIAFKQMCFMKADLIPKSKNREQRTEVGNLSV